jgi:UPF0755 protein
MTNAHDVLEELRLDGAARFGDTALARDHQTVTRRVRRDRAVRASVTGAASVVGVAAAAGAAYGIQRAMQPSDLIIITTPAATPSATPMTTINVGKQESIHQIAADLEAAVGSPGDDAMAALINALPPEANGNPEGWVIAGDYTFDAGTNLQAAAVQLMGMLVTQLEAYDVPRDEWADTVVKASIIQAEAAVPNDQAIVSRVIQNRLDADMPLSLDSPLAYALGKNPRELTSADVAADNPYNTFTQTGLPPGAIGAPTQYSLEAAVHPAMGDWRFFIMKPDGTIAMTNNYPDFADLKEQYYPTD